MNQFLNALTNDTNFKYTENGSLAHKTTRSDLLDFFAVGASYRSRSDSDCIFLFKKAYAENPEYALKCLFYIRAVRDGQGERRFFRVVYNWLASYDTDAARRNMKFIPELCRWDDLFCLFDTPLENEMLSFVTKQLALDVQSKTPSLLAKWMPSINASKSACKQAVRFKNYLKWTNKQYRKTLSILRARINVLERLMSAGRWDEIEFDKIPSKAGFKYRNAFARRDMIKAKYHAFMKDEKTTVNAGTLYPYECVEKARGLRAGFWNIPALDDVQRLAINKYWENLKDYFNGATFNGLAVVDVSGSMFSGLASVAPINVAISLGLYCADKAQGPFANHFITFSKDPRLVKVDGIDFCDKVWRMGNADWGYNTNLEAVFNMMLQTAVNHETPASELPDHLIVISDMEIDRSLNGYSTHTVVENARKKWARYGYKLPRLVYWNVNARNDTFLDNDPDATYISGFSPIIFEQLMTGKTGYDLMMEVLNKECFAGIK